MPSSLQKGIIAAKAGRMQEALNFMKDAMIEEPQNAEVWVWIAAILDDLKEQEIFLKQALAIDPNNVSAQQGLAYLQQQMRDQAAAGVGSLSDPVLTESPKKTSNSLKTSMGVKGKLANLKEKIIKQKSENKLNGGNANKETKRIPLRNIILGALVLVFCVLGSLAASIIFNFNLPFSLPSLEQIKRTKSQPKIEILSATASALELIVRFPADPIRSPSAENLTIFDEAFFSHPADPGVPDLPVFYEEVEIPAGQTVEIQVLDSKSYAGTLGEGNLPASIPNREPDFEKCSPEVACSPVNSSPLMQAAPVFPETPVKITGVYIIRGHQIAQLEFWPVQFNSANQTVEIYKQIKLRIVISGPDPRTSADNANTAAQTFEDLLSKTVLNYSPLANTQAERAIGGEGYLIIAPDAFSSTLGPLVDLKEAQGFSVTVASLSKMGPSAENIRAYIQNAYSNWPVPPTYVLLVGDIDNGALSMPSFTGYSSSSATDLYYGTVDGSDWIPDIHVGRLPARSTSQLNTMISNLVAYHNLTGKESWIKKAALLASDDPNYWTIAEGTQNYVIENHTLPASYTGIFPYNPQAGGDKLYAYSYGANTAKVQSTMNQGHSLVAYTGHGSRIAWSGPAFNRLNIRSMTSNGTFSVVASFACYTGQIDFIESFGETWLLQPNKGAVAFVGSSASTYWSADDILERAMIDSLYSGEESANIVGKFRFAGLMAVEASRPGTDKAQSRYYWESYNLLGDPSLEMLIGQNSVPAYKPLLRPDAVEATQAPGQEAIIHLTLTNVGAQPDRYSIELTQGGWTAEIQNSDEIELSPGESTTLEIVISVPENAPYGQIEEYVLKAASMKDPANPPARDRTTIILTAGNVYIFPIFFP